MSRMEIDESVRVLGSLAFHLEQLTCEIQKMKVPDSESPLKDQVVLELMRGQRSLDVSTEKLRAIAKRMESDEMSAASEA